MKQKRLITLFLFVFIIVLLVVCGCLFKQNMDYNKSIRKLILQNDSLKSVVIELSRKIAEAKREEEKYKEFKK